ncbi:MAG TPA: AmmeMemoRadiSam system radical SAM enzyme [Anaerolineales bacterium]|nr:AmmeMemoRadiSam system radical SAM enzyme [Anaerolineales bacterium]
MKEAQLYEKRPDGKVECHLCGHHCVIAPDKFGVCQVRQNQGGTLYTLVYGSAISQNVDPIEKKPLYHFYPGSRAFSVATLGCNFQCEWCQNWQIAQAPRSQGLLDISPTSPADLVANAKAVGARSIAYTYTEPTIFFEYTYETSKLAQKAGLANVYVTNGYMTGEMLDMLHPTLDAANVDLKAFRQKTYSRYVGAGLQTVLDSMKKMKELDIWLEVTSLLIPDVNDSPEEVYDMAEFITQELGTDTPWHISRFFPQYKMSHLPPTPPKTLQTAYEIGKAAGLEYIYMGNVAGESNTRCPECGTLLIQRRGYQIGAVNIREGRCPTCSHEIAGVWGNSS